MPGPRLDVELVRRGLARSRTHAAALIISSRVTVSGRIATKPAMPVTDTSAVVVADAAGDDWASRGAHKLLGALDRFGIDVTGLRALDAGASTGGFTDVLLRGGAREVVAVDVGAGQLVPRLATDPHVRVVDRTNIRTLTPDRIGGAVDLVVADLSFISLRLALPALIACARPDAQLLPMVKPQFEVGRGRLGSGGVVRDPVQRADAVLGVARHAAELGWPAVAAVASPLPGPSGNVEYFLRLRRCAPPDAPLREMVLAAVRDGPQ